MQRAQGASDNPALDVAVEPGNELGKSVVAFFAPVLFYPHAYLRHYRFLTSGIPDIEEGLSKRDVGFVLQTYPDHSLIKFCEQVRAIVGKHDRPWFERPVFGQVRYMSYASTSKKFDSKHYIQNVKRLEASHV